MWVTDPTTKSLHFIPGRKATAQDLRRRADTHRMPLLETCHAEPDLYHRFARIGY